MELKIKRVYEPYVGTDGYRILVDRLWPRGIKKELAHVDVWLKEIGPSTELRKWFDHDLQKWVEFKRKYEHELEENPALPEIKELLKKHKTVTLLYGAKDETHNQSVVLKKFLS